MTRRTAALWPTDGDGTALGVRTSAPTRKALGRGLSAIVCTSRSAPARQGAEYPRRLGCRVLRAWGESEDSGNRGRVYCPARRAGRRIGGQGRGKKALAAAGRDDGAACTVVKKPGQGAPAPGRKGGYPKGPPPWLVQFEMRTDHAVDPAH